MQTCLDETRVNDIFDTSMVTLASAMLVAKMILRVSRGGGSKMTSCSSGGRVAYSGNGNSFGAAFGNLSLSATCNL